MNRTKHMINALVALRQGLWYAASDENDDGERPERRENAIAGLRSFWLTLTPDEQQWVLDALEENPAEAEGIRQAVLHGNVGLGADEPD